MGSPLRVGGAQKNKFISVLLAISLKKQFLQLFRMEHNDPLIVHGQFNGC